jgi:hypothetical protein
MMMILTSMILILPTLSTTSVGSILLNNTKKFTQNINKMSHQKASIRVSIKVFSLPKIAMQILIISRIRINKTQIIKKIISHKIKAWFPNSSRNTTNNSPYFQTLPIGMLSCKKTCNNPTLIYIM